MIEGISDPETQVAVYIELGYTEIEARQIIAFETNQEEAGDLITVQESAPNSKEQQTKENDS